MDQFITIPWLGGDDAQMKILSTIAWNHIFRKYKKGLFIYVFGSSIYMDFKKKRKM